MTLQFGLQSAKSSLVETKLFIMASRPVTSSTPRLVEQPYVRTRTYSHRTVVLPGDYFSSKLCLTLTQTQFGPLNLVSRACQ